MLRKKFLYIFGIIAIITTGSFAIVGTTYAEEDRNNSVITETLLQGMVKCYEKNVFKKNVKISSLSAPQNIVYAKYYIPIPNGLVGSISDPTISCEDLISGKVTYFHGSSKSLLTTIPSAFDKDSATKAKFLEDMGYKGIETDNRCTRFAYKTSSQYSGSFNYYTHYLCADVDKNGVITSDVTVKNGGTDSSENMVTFTIDKNSSTIDLKCKIVADISTGRKGSCNSHNYVKNTTQWDKLINDISVDLEFNNNTGVALVSIWGGATQTYTYVGIDPAPVTEYELPDDPNEAASTMLKAFTGSTAVPTIDNDEKAQLYVTYLKEYYNSVQNCGKYETDEEKKPLNIGEPGGWYEYRKNDKGEMCYIKPDAKKENDVVNGIDGEGKIKLNSATYKDIVDFLKDYKGDVDVNLDTASTLDPELTTNEADANTCANSGAAESLGWIVCPVIEWLGRAVDSVYSEYLEPSLRIPPKLFSDENEGVLNGWDTFRNIANIIFIILLLTVIFSQITGVGIDNYGIKKILPKLIISAILINLSYLICILLIDLSNILGNGFQAMFDGLITNGGLKPELNISGADNIGAISSTVITSVGVAGALAVMVGSIWMNPAVILSLLIGLLGVVISLFFLFILLAAREAAVVVLVVISPLAVVCYMLPNTKKYFDKWVKFFQGLLLVYPICGLLVGGGNYVSSLLLSSGFALDGFPQALTAMLIGVIPIFFIPTVLKNSLNAIGNLGTKISGIGKSLGSKSQAAIRNTDAYKNAQAAGKRRETRLKAGVDANGNPIEMGRFGRMIRGGKRSIARNRAAYLRDQSELANIDRLMSDEGMNAALSGIRTTEQDKAVSDKLSLLRSNGITMKDGTTKSFDLATAKARMSELEEKARSGNLSSDEEQEVAALARGMAGEKGGATMINDIVMNANDGNGGLNAVFLAALGKAYAQDSTVRSKMNEKSGKIGSYMDAFTPGGEGLRSGNERAKTYSEADAAGQLTDRAKSYEAKLNQGGQALQDTINSFTAEQCQNIYDQGLEKLLDAKDLETFQEHAKILGVNGRSDTQALKQLSQQLGGTPASPSPTSQPAPVGSNTFDMHGNTYTQTPDGRILDEQGTAYNNPDFIVQHHNDLRKQNYYRGMDDAKIRQLSTNTNASEAVRRGASEEMKRRGLS